MLIDAGDKSNTDAIREELDERGITDIDILVATHPHADHIGGIAEIIKNYNISMVYMSDKTSESNTYENFVGMISVHHIHLSPLMPGSLLTLVMHDVRLSLLGKMSMNPPTMRASRYSSTMKIRNSCLQAIWKRKAEQAVLEGGYNVDADVLKVAHHGSSSSTSDAFLRAVTPEYAVISCGEDNSYGHPHAETLESLDAFGADVLRTDQSGDVLFISDGQNIEVVLGD